MFLLRNKKIIFELSSLPSLNLELCGKNHMPIWPGRVAQSVGHLIRKSEVLGSIPSLATYFRFSFC